MSNDSMGDAFGGLVVLAFDLLDSEIQRSPERLAEILKSPVVLSTAQKGLLETGDLQEALNAATQIGDDAIQRRTQGYVVPESFNHGTSAQRREWFNRGFESGKLSDCDTFNNPV